ncbi:hypothetical protein VTN00DRAFT_5890 [Thermoascus crustaceus]|uniref:uncharacterized protein n=1 Tax=Thermoascus crustaceus TaxID=5088 RepID=UPI00374466F9
MARRKSDNPRYRALGSTFDNSQSQDMPDIDRRCLQKRSCTVCVENNPTRIDGWKCAIVLEPQQLCVILSISAPSQNIHGSASLSFPVETCDIDMGLEKPDHGEEEVARLRTQYPGWFKRPESKHRFIRIHCTEDPVKFSVPWDIQEETCRWYDDLSRLIKKASQSGSWGGGVTAKEDIDKSKNNDRQALNPVDLERSRSDVRIATFEHEISGLEYEISERRLRVAKLREKLAQEHIARFALDN